MSRLMVLRGVCAALFFGIATTMASANDTSESIARALMPDLDQFERAYQKARAANAARGIDSRNGISRSWRPSGPRERTRGYHSEVPVMRTRRRKTEPPQRKAVTNTQQSAPVKKAEPRPVTKAEPKPPPQPSYSTAKVTFEYDSAEITPSGREVLNVALVPALQSVHSKVAQLTRSMATQVTVEFTVIGHTDAKGSEDYNFTLSRKRAQAVCNHLRSQGYAGPLRCVGMGESQLADPYQPDSGINRRVEITAKAMPIVTSQ